MNFIKINIHMRNSLQNIVFYRDLLRLSNYRSNLKEKEIINTQKYEAQAKQKIQTKGDKFTNRMNSLNPSEITSSTVWKCIIEEFRPNIFLCYLLKQMDYILKVVLCIFVSFIFQSFQENQKWKCFSYAGGFGLIWILQSIFCQCAVRQVQQNSFRIKGALTYSIYLKLLSVSSFQINGKESAEIMNAIVEFHDILENQSIYIFALLSAPIGIVGIVILLVRQIGWMSIVGIAFHLLIAFINYHFAEYNSRNCIDIMALKDKRVNILTEAISAFRYIKMQVWENLFIERIKSIRSKQMKSFLKYAAGKSLQQSFAEGINGITIILVIGLTAIFNDGLTSTQVISAVMYVSMATVFTICSSYGINCYYRVNALLQRIASLFAIKNKKNIELKKKVNQQRQQQPKKQGENALALSSVWCSYKEDIQKEYILKQVNFTVKKGEFIGLFGKVGAGKSTLLYTITKLIPNAKGSVDVSEEVSFQQSQPALFIGTVKENVLFGKAFNQQLFQKAMKYSCLDSDLSRMDSGDQTLIEEGGVNLSGGQRTRLCLARAIYADKPILVLDDPLSSIDLKVMDQIMCNLFKLIKLEGKTIILGTHQTHCLAKCDRCFEVKDSTMYQLSSSEFQEIKQSYKKNQQAHRQISLLNDSLQNQNGEKYQTKILQQQNTTKTQISQQMKSLIRSLFSYILKNKGIRPISQFQGQQKAGFVKKLFGYAFKSKLNYIVFPATLLCYAGCQTCFYLFVLFLNQIDEVKAKTNKTFESQTSFWTTLGVMAVCVFMAHYIRYFLLSLTIQLANKSLHDEGLSHVFGAKILELDKIGIKGILDKFSTDLGLLDIGISFILHSQFFVVSIFSIQFLIVAIINPIMIPFIVIILVPNYIWYLYSVDTISALRQMDLKQKGPIISLFSETINGLTQIQINSAQEYMTNKLKILLNKSILLGVNNKSLFRAYVSTLNYYTTLAMIASYFAIIAMNDSEDYINFIFVAVALVELNDWILWAFQYATIINSTLVSANRLATLSEIPTETSKMDNNSKQRLEKLPSELRINITQNQGDSKSNSSNSIELHNVALKYGESSDLALKDISIEVKGGHKIALIGRSGSGKSSIIQALYRLVEPQTGSAYSIEGRNALSMDIAVLRSRFTCIPQTPFIYSDTLRAKLDPFAQYSDEQIEESLRKVCIYDYVAGLPKGMHTSLAEGEASLSSDQQQLLCLARAVLENRDFLILDEATSNIDERTDEIIQKVLRREFVGKTIVCVAHRLQTVMDFDKIVVLSHGRILQQGTADKLMANKGEFYRMVHESGCESKLIHKIEEKNGE